MIAAFISSSWTVQPVYSTSSLLLYDGTTKILQMVCESGAGGNRSAPVNGRSAWQMIVSFTTLQIAHRAAAEPYLLQFFNRSCWYFDEYLGCNRP
jgi:hypothetical protein